MQLKKYKSSFFLISTILIVVSLLFLTINKQQIVIAVYDLNQKMMSADIGVSSFGNLLDSGEGDDNKEVTIKTLKTSIIPLTISLIKFIPATIKYRIFDEDKFDRVDINIDFSDYLTLMRDRDRAIKNSILDNHTKVGATLQYKGQKYKARLRLKGDMVDHWLSKNRYSLRVDLKNEKTILGFSSFSIQKPRSRQYPYNHIFQSIARDTGNITPIHKFAHVFVNGEDWGIMDIEEHMSKELLEKQKKKESIIVRFSNDDLWMYEAKSEMQYDGYKVSDPFIFSSLYNNKSLKNEQNRKVYSYIVNNRLSNNKDLYDTDSFSRALILALVWNEFHTLEYSNSRYYFNPYTLKLEIITTDQLRWKEIKDDISQLNKVQEKRYVKIQSNQDFLDHLYKNLIIINNAISNIDKHSSYFQSLFPIDKNKNTKIIKDNMKRILDNKEKYIIYPIKSHDIKNELNATNTVMNSPILPSRQQASEFKEHLHIRHFKDGTLELYNLLPDNVTVKNILFNGKSFADNEVIVPSYLSNPKPTIIKTPYKGIQDGMFMVRTNYQGFNRITKSDITLVKEGINNQLLLNTENEFSFIDKLDDTIFEIKQGSWTVNKPIIVDGDLHISPGVNLQFSNDSYIIVKGALTAIGDELNPITLGAELDSWKGIYVLNADKKSQIENVNISNLVALEDGLLQLTGGITFYKSDVNFENVKISNVKAEDAINIIESSFLLNSVFIDNAVSDGLDSDFSKGSVLHSKFSDIGGDALDFSGSKVSIINTKASNVKDKAVSAGEKSTLNIENSQFSNIGIGVASKDGSAVNISNTSILDYKLYAAMSFIKKDFYGAPIININNCYVSDDNAYIRQKGTTMIVDNIQISESEINVEKLYK
jgi:hypothetical protein